MYNTDSGGKSRVYIPAGIYRTTDTIHLGYGTTFTSIVVEGDGYRYRGESGFSGTAIIADFDDRPAFNFQGARGSVLRGVSIKGLNYDQIADNGLGALGSTEGTIDDTVAANWVDASFPASADSRYAPYVAITIDAYSGTAPATANPDVTFPSYTGIATQYGKNYSSGCLIEDVMISGFVAGVVNQPCDADGNDDFTVLKRVTIEMCKYAVSVGNSQSRNVGIHDSNLGPILDNSVVRSTSSTTPQPAGHGYETKLPERF